MTKISPSGIEKRTKMLIGFLKTPKGIALFLVVVAIVFNAIVLWPEVGIPTMNLHDEVYHYAATREASSALSQGYNPTDFWFSQIELGYPLFHHYQHLPQLILTLINQFTASFLSLARLFDVSRYLLLVFFPLSVFWAMSRLGFNPISGGIAALVSSLISTNGLFGLEYGSYVWRGFGLYPQLWAMFFLPLALAELYRAVCKSEPIFKAVLLATVVALSQVFYGYFLFFSAVIFTLIKFNKKEILIRLKRLALIFLMVGLVTSYFWLPLLKDFEYTNRSQWIPSWKYDSFGVRQTLSYLVGGELLDYGRFPSLTLLFLISLAFLVLERRKEYFRALLYLFVFTLFLFFGRVTWGAILNILPFSRLLQFHRFIGGLHLAVVMIMGAGGFLIWQWFRKHFPRLSLLIIGIFLVVLIPVYAERIRFCQENKLWRNENQKAFLASREELSDIKKTLEGLPPGRVFAGLPATWGNYPYYQIGSVSFYAIFPQWGIDSFGYSYHSEALTADVRLLFDDAKPVQYNLFNIRYVLLHKTWEAPFYYYPVKEFKNYALYQVQTTGYFDLVDASAVFYGSSSDFYSVNSQWLFSLLPELKQHPILELGETPYQTFGLPVFAFEKVNQELLNRLSEHLSPRGNIFQEDIKSQSYGVRFEAFREAYLMLKANYHSGWQVYVDGKKASPVMLAPGFIGVLVEPGTHEAFFYYKPPVYRLPLLIFGILVLLVMFFKERKFFVTKTMKKLLTREKTRAIKRKKS